VVPGLVVVFEFALCLGDEVGGQFANPGDGFAVEHDPALDHGLGHWTQRPADRRQNGRAEEQRRGADRDAGERIAFEHVLDQSHSRLHSSSAAGAHSRGPHKLTPSTASVADIVIFFHDYALFSANKSW